MGLGGEFVQEFIRRDIHGWEKNYEFFTIALGSLFSKTHGRLRFLDLQPCELETAMEELERILSDAITRYHSVIGGDETST